MHQSLIYLFADIFIPPDYLSFQSNLNASISIFINHFSNRSFFNYVSNKDCSMTFLIGLLDYFDLNVQNLIYLKHLQLIIFQFDFRQMKPTRKKGTAVLKVSVPTFKFQKANQYQQMYEQAFQMGQQSFDEKMKKGIKKSTLKQHQKLPSLVKNQGTNSSRIKQGKLKPLNDKLTHSRLAQKQSYMKQSSAENIQWIKDLTKKQHFKIERPARSPERLNQSMRRHPQPLDISPSKKHQPIQQIESSSNINLSTTQTNKEGASRNLKDYDCWDNDLTPQEWLQKYKQTPAPHGKAPIYQGGEYVWTDIELINYDEKSGKFYIRVLSNGLLKFVSRLSIQFRDQDPERFSQRLELTKERQKQADQSIKLQKYIESVDQKIIAPMPQKLTETLLQNHSTHPMFGQLLDEIKSIHKNYEKKFLLYDKKNQMLLPEPLPSVGQFESLPIVKYERYDQFETAKKILQDNHISTKPKQLKCQKQILQKGVQIVNKYKLLGTIPDTNTTYLLQNFKERIDKQSINSKQNWEIIWRSHIISEIQHILKEQYRFFVTEKEAYESDHLKRVIIKFDVLFNTIIREKIINQGIQTYVSFIKSFMAPKPNEYYRLRSCPLLVLQMNINMTATKKKKKQPKVKGSKGQASKLENLSKIQSQIQDEAGIQQTIYFEPSLQSVEQVLLSPFETLEMISNSFNKIQRDLIPLLNLQSVPSYPIRKDDAVLVYPSNYIGEFIKQASQKPLQILNHFKSFGYLIEKSTTHILKQLFPTKGTVSITFLDKDEIEGKLNQIFNAKKTIQKLSIDQVNCGLFQVRTKIAKQTLVARAIQILNEILKKILQICSQSIKTIKKNYQERQKKLMPEEPSLLNEEELKELHKLVSENDTTMQKLKNQVDTIGSYFQILEKYLYNIDERIYNSFWHLKIWPQNIKDAVGQATRIIQEREAKLSQKLDSQKQQFTKKLQQIDKQLQQIKKYTEYSEVNKYYSKVVKFQQSISQCKKQVQSFNHRQEMFKQPQSTYEQLDTIQQNFLPYFRMWSTGIKFDLEKQKTVNGPLLKNNFAQLDKAINKEYMKETFQLIKQFDNLSNETASNILTAMKQDIQRFRETLWLIQLLTTEALIKKQHYWKEISDACGVQKIQPNDQLTLKFILQKGLDKFREQIQQISKKAEKQWSLQKKLNGIIEDLKKLQIQTKPYAKANSHILEAIDDSTQILDDNLNSLLMMKSSPYIKPIITRANNVQTKIVLIQDTLQNWIKTQRGWMYLEPIFSSEDIQQKMPLEKQKFEQVDKHWKQTLQYFTKQKNIWDNIDSEKYKTQFENSNRLLDEIQKSLSEYLQTKRRFFPRFYFLSDEELLEILAQTKDPETVQRHINKCFEGIGQLKMSKGIVSGMISMEKEEVDFSKKVDVNEGEKKGNVERWLSEIQGVMIQTLKKITKTAIQDQTERVKWVRKWPAQTVLGVNMIRWTAKAEQAITNGAIKQFVQQLVQELKEIVVLVRTDLSQLDRLTLGALVTIDVHGKDVVQSLLDQNCNHIQDFSWMAQLRYYWQNDKYPKNPLPVKMINAQLLYAFEYLGNSPRLVITPLTDRCYRTLMGAFHLYYGGAPEGPAGTGKTETVKDLSKALSVQCVVFNCSDGLNYIAMRKFFKGLASSGAWCCFDQFNRIDLEVLSVIAQQVLTIQSAIRQKKKIFNFDGEDIILVASCAINITMNPGYAGRSQLPDNLKALFRPCAMMVPDYALIAEIYLYSVGFEEARDLARKIVASLKLSSQQLSSQDHYDFGMRALKAILTAAGNLKRVMLDDKQDVVCLRALMDVNIPKFTVNDVPLFSSITSDLFPSTKLPKIDYGKLQEAFVSYCISKKLQPEQGFLSKCIQLYDTVNVRHGLMVVGAAFSGKSKVTEVLAEGMSALAGIQNFVKVQQIKLNPKSITSDQLYGKLDPNTKSWSDGVIAIIMRKCAQQAEMKERKWVVFDGPVDAVWIENMNTVLDDNKKLCLTSGQIIKLTSWMTMMFEVQDLSQASPATVSRCGMVFLETKQLGWFALVKTFILNLPERLDKQKQHLQDKLKYIINGCLAWTRKYGKFLVHQSQMTFVNTLLRVLDTYLGPYANEQTKIPKQIDDIMANLVVFCAIWSIGIALEETTRKPFNTFFVHLINGSPDIIRQSKIDPDYEMNPVIYGAKLPQKVHIFDMFYNMQKMVWQNWSQTVPAFIIPKGISYNELIIPTNDSIRHNYFLNLNVKNHMHVLFCGPTGTGKSINVANQLNLNYYNQQYTFLTTAFSGQTVANQIQRLVDSKVCTRRRKGHFWPEEGKNQIVIFIDDLNMPQKQKYGAQPPIQLLRQWMDNGGWYDLDTKQFKHLCGINFIAAMLPPIGGRNVVTMRYLRHYNLIYIEPFDTDSLNKIFGNILEWYFISLPQALPKAITGMKQTIVQSTIELYTKVQTSKQLLPTPAKSHYIYNLRDLSKVFQGITKAKNKSFQNQNDFLKLWAHECSRIFKDRLISNQDQTFFDNLLKDMLRSNFKRQWSSLVQVEPLLWASFVPTIYPDGDTTKKPLNDIYCELTNRDAVKKKCQSALEQFNNLYSGNRMNLVLFMVAIQHIVKIVRVLTTTFGHALLVGVGGSGRKSLAMLSSYIAYMTEYNEVNSKNWVQEVQKVMKIAGLQQRQTIFLFSDTQVLRESMVEEVCNILNNGQIPNLFPTQQKAKIVQQITAIKPVGSFNEKYQYFVQLCKNNLHMVICMSPVGQDFRRRLRTFPTLVNCTTIDWFLPWPQEALISTADSHFKDNMGINDEVLRKGLVKISVDMQLRVIKLRNRYQQQLRRYYYVTPTSYLQLLSTMKKLLSARKSDVDGQIKRYQDGCNKIAQTEAQVAVMQKQLQELKPKLEIATIQNKQLLVDLQKNQKKADAERAICEQQEKQCNIQRDQANKLRADCQADLDRVLPLLDQAAAALDKISQDDMTQLKSYNNPPPAAAIVMQGVCYIFEEDSKIKFTPKQPGSMEKIQDFWGYSKKNLLNAKLIQRVKDFRQDKIKAIPQKNISKLKTFMLKPDFEKEKVFAASKAAGSLSMWIRAVVNTYQALLVVEPKKKQLSQAEQKLKSAEATLAQKKAALQKVLSILRDLQQKYKNAKQKEEQLKRNVQKCIIQLDRAQKLIKGLGGQKIAWGHKVVQWTGQKQTVLGDCVLCSGIIAYMGAFPISYRDDTLTQWKQLLKNLNIKSNATFSLQNILSNPLQIGQWTNQQQLPNDDFSIDNAIIYKNSSRWPLMIDPQIQANNWIKIKEQKDLKIIRPNKTHKQLELILENTIQLGLPLLLQNVTETIDSIFQPVLQKKLIKSGASYRLKFGEKQLQYSNDFRFYMTTKLGKPHYSPQICVKVTLLNFQVTLQGLDDQMLNIVVKMQEPIKQQQKQRNIKEFFANKKKQTDTQNLILKLLGSAEGNLLDDQKLIDTLQNSKKQSEQIAEKMQKLEYFRTQFNTIRNFYKEVSKRIANLYFITLDLANIEPTYQWSLEFYINLFERAIEKATPGKQNRCKNIIDKFQILFYQSLCRSLLEKDKLVFSFLIFLKIMLSEKKIENPQIRFMMVGGTWIESPQPIPSTITWMTNKTWCTLCEVGKNIKGFNTVVQDFKTHFKQFTAIYNSQDPYSQTWPGRWKDASNFHRLVLIRIIRPDKFTHSVQKIISDQIGRQYIEPPPFNLQQTYKDSDCNTPLIFILSPGADPRLQITNLAEKTGFKNSFASLSLGQGQGQLAQRAIKLAMSQGKWVLLQNCHLAPSFMPQLQRILQNATEIHKDFRIWLTSMPSNLFPVTILMKGIKMTYEPPRGLKNNLIRSFSTIDQAKYQQCQKPRQWKKMFLGLSFFHALILQRRKFGPLGWNIPYEFTAADFAISQSQLKMFLNEYEMIPYQALNYMAAEANYGGRVTDPMDRRLIKIILKTFYSQDILKNNFKMTKDSVYKIMDQPTFSSALQYIKGLPMNDSTEVFGLHRNAQISSAIIQTNTTCENILMLLPRDVGGAGVSTEHLIKQKIKQILIKLPKPFDTDEAAKKHPVKYEQSMNTVLQQELFRFNKLLKTVHSSLVNVDKAIDGFVVMSQQLQVVFNSLFDNRVPDMWHKVSYPSMKPLGSWVNDFVERLKFMQKWVDQGAPVNFWISGFFFTQSFLTGVLQNYARKYKIPIDTLSFDYFVIPKDSKQNDVTKAPADGCYIYGLYFDGARWDEDLKCLNQSHPKVLYSSCPYILLLPTNNRKEPSLKQSYTCPVYKTSVRRGILSTTGHSTNYVLSITLPIQKSTSSDHWVKRGVAMLTQLDD